MTVTNGYITAAEFKAATSGGITQSTKDAEIDRSINAASRSIDRYCRRRFWQDATVAVRYYTAEDPCLVVTDDISTSTGLLVKTDPGDDGTFEVTWTIDTDFRLAPVNAAADSEPWTSIEKIRSGSYSFPGHEHRVQVTAKFGWAAVPADVVEACMIQAQRFFARGGAPFGVAGGSEFGVVRLLNKLDPDVEALVKPFKRLHVPSQSVAWV